MPVELKIALGCLIAAVLLVLLARIIWPKKPRPARPKRGHSQAKRGQTIDERRREVELEDLRQAEADKPPYQPPTPGFPPTAGMQAISKLPGQDRLTRDDWTGQAVQDKTISAAADDHLSGAGSPSQRPDPPLVAGEPPRLRSGDPALAQGSAQPEHPVTSAMPAVLPPVRPVPRYPAPTAHPEPPAPTGPQPDSPPEPPTDSTSLLPLVKETRAERRRRMERESADRPESP